MRYGALRTLMSYRAWFNGLSPLRRLVLLAGCVLWTVWASWLPFAFSDAAIARWSQVEIAAFVLLGAIAGSIVVLEMVRVVWPRQWSDARHFIALGIVGTAFFALQYTGLRLMLESFSK